MGYAEYIDDYPTCDRTFVMLKVFNLPPSVVTSSLGLEPTWTATRGAARMPWHHGSRQVETDYWRLDSEAAVDSFDTRRHLDWLLDRLEAAATALRNLRQEGAEIVIQCVWVSRQGDGGPILSPTQSRRLANLNLEIGFMTHFIKNDEPDDEPEERGLPN